MMEAGGQRFSDLASLKGLKKEVLSRINGTMNQLFLNRRHFLRSSLAMGAGSFAGLPLFGQTAAPTGPFVLPPLSYAADSLEPYIDAQTMTIHHDKHHATYVTKLNEGVAKLSSAPAGTLESLKGMLSNLDAVPEEIRTVVRNHGGGHFNHTLFWESLSAKKSAPSAGLAKAIDAAFKTHDAFLAEMQDKGGKAFGSAWVWLCYDPKSKGLAVTTTPNQDTPLAVGHVPLLGIDVWEHAYYLKYQNKRPDYLKAIVNVINWDVVSARYDEAAKA